MTVLTQLYIVCLMQVNYNIIILVTYVRIWTTVLFVAFIINYVYPQRYL